MTIECFKEKCITNFKSPAWFLLEKVVTRMTEREIFIDSIEGVGLVKDSHDGKQVRVRTVYRNNGTKEDVSVRIVVDEWRDKKYTKHCDTKISAGASDKVINRRIDKVIDALK